jgi:hypothetical protein
MTGRPSSPVIQDFPELAGGRPPAGGPDLVAQGNILGIAVAIDEMAHDPDEGHAGAVQSSMLGEHFAGQSSERTGIYTREEGNNDACDGLPRALQGPCRRERYS